MTAENVSNYFDVITTAFSSDVTDVHLVVLSRSSKTSFSESFIATAHPAMMILSRVSPWRKHPGCNRAQRLEAEPSWP